LEESLSIITFGIVGILGLEPTHNFLLFPEEDEDKTLREGFLKVKEVENTSKRVLCNMASLKSFS